MANEACEFPEVLPADDTIRAVLEQSKTIAVIGLSKQPEKPSHFVPRYLQEHGYRIIPVNPTAKGTLLGEQVYGTLPQIPHKVDVVNIFRPASEVPALVKEAIAIGAKAVWMQEGIVHNEAGKQAMDAGLTVVMNRCMMKEHCRLKG